jgi:prepilin-type N-terminal cleavage/methylation domain-containing protein
MLTARPPRPSERGFTLVELIVAASVMAIVAAAIGTAFVTSFRTTSAANDRMAQAADAQLLATYWPADVASLDATGYMAPPACGPDTEIVTFAWDLSGPATSETRVTYGARGTGAGSEVVRHHCRGGSTTPDASVVVARHFGGPSPAGAETWLKGPGGVGQPGCDARTCTIHVAGTYDFEVSAARRVPPETG